MMMDLRNRIKNNRKQVEKNEFAEPNQKIADYMMAEYPAPDALKEQILKAMTEQRAREEQAEEKYSNIRRKAFKHVAAAAALLAFFMGFTPIRGMVVSAAEEFRYLTSWTDDVFEVGIKKTKNHCSMELIEASVANDFLYLTTENSYQNEALWENDISVRYSGYIYDSIFHKLAFSTDNIFGTNFGGSGRPTVYAKYAEADDAIDDSDDCTKIYIPEIKEMITDSGKQYKCKLTADFVDKNGKSITKMNFKFQIGTTEGVTTSKEIPLSYTTTVDDLRFDFEKIVVSQNNSAELFVQLIPQNGYEIKEDLWLDMCIAFRDGQETRSFIDDVGYYYFYRTVREEPTIYQIDSRYYAIFSLNYGYFWDNWYDNEGYRVAFEDESFDFNENENDFQMYLIELGYGEYNSDERHYTAVYGDGGVTDFGEQRYFERLETLDFLLPELKTDYHKMNDISINHIGDSYAFAKDGKNTLTVNGKKFTFEELILHVQEYYDNCNVYEGRLYMTGTHLSEKYGYDDALCYMNTIELAAVKDGETLYTVLLKNEYSLASRGNMLFLSVVARFYDNEGNEMKYKTIQEMEYDDIVITRFDFYSYDNSNPLAGLAETVNGYHYCYNPKYYSKAQCEEDVAAKIEAVQSRVIR